MVSVCVAVYRVHGPPDVAGVGAALPRALAEPGELVVALNGVDARAAGVPAGARAADLGVNRGVAPGWNAAARVASGEVLVFCNDDVELGPDSLTTLVGALRAHPDAGVVGAAGSRWDLTSGEHGPWFDLDGRPAGAVVECEATCGYLFACRRCTWEAVGGFDERYAPASWEEIDFCTAVRATGARCYAVAGVEYRHEWGVSRRQMPWARARWEGRSETWRSIHRRNRARFLAKWAHHPVAQAEVREDASPAAHEGDAHVPSGAPGGR